jgi:hypothetical protein
VRSEIEVLKVGSEKERNEEILDWNISENWSTETFRKKESMSWAPTSTEL